MRAAGEGARLSGPAAGPLGKNTSILSPRSERRRDRKRRKVVRSGQFDVVEDAAEWVPSADERETRFRMRAANWEVSKSSRQRKCGRCRRQSDVLVKVVPETGAHFSGLVTCGSVHCCPVCSAVIQVQRRKQLQEAEETARGKGFGYLHVTVTARHSEALESRELYEAQSAAFSHARSGAPWQRWCDRYGIPTPYTIRGSGGAQGEKLKIGSIRATDATVGSNGLHIHFHTAMITRRPLTDEEAEDLRAFLFARYARKLRALGFDALEHDPETGRPLGIVVTQVPDLGDYLAKLPLAWELTASQTKAAARGSRTMWEVLRDVAAGAEVKSRKWKRDRAIWREWSETMHGKNSLVWSPGLRAVLLGTEEDQTDGEVAEAAASAGREVGRIPGPVWDRLAHLPAAQASVLAAAPLGQPAIDLVISGYDLGAVSAAQLRDFAELQRHQDRQNIGQWLGTVEGEDRAARIGIAARDVGGVREHLARSNLFRFVRRSRIGEAGAFMFVPPGGDKKLTGGV